MAATFGTKPIDEFFALAAHIIFSSKLINFE